MDEINEQTVNRAVIGLTLKCHLETLTPVELLKEFQQRTSWREAQKVLIDALLSCETSTLSKMLAEFEDEDDE